MNFTQSIGNINELMCLAKFIELGYECSIPYGNGAKYDFIADINGEMLRIQCKSATTIKSKSQKDEAFSIATSSTTTNTKKTVRHTYDKTQIDYFATYYKGKVYLIPVEECSTSKTLRFTPPLNNNKYNKAEDYEIEKIIPQSNTLIESKEEFFKSRNITQHEEKPMFCSECGSIITKYSDSGLCAKCSAKKTRVVERPSREELKSMIRSKPFVQIAKQFGVSDNAIRKWCKAENLPSKVSEIKQYSEQEWENI